jgi:hypothetical protein
MGEGDEAWRSVLRQIVNGYSKAQEDRFVTAGNHVIDQLHPHINKANIGSASMIGTDMSAILSGVGSTSGGIVGAWNNISLGSKDIKPTASFWDGITRPMSTVLNGTTAQADVNSFAKSMSLLEAKKEKGDNIDSEIKSIKDKFSSSWDTYSDEIKVKVIELFKNNGVKIEDYLNRK